MYYYISICNASFKINLFVILDVLALPDTSTCLLIITMLPRLTTVKWLGKVEE